MNNEAEKKPIEQMIHNEDNILEPIVEKIIL